VGLTFDGKWHRTINDVTTELKTSQKTIKKLVEKGDLPMSKLEVHGTRKFNHYDDEWIEEARNYFKKIRSK